MPTWLGLWSTSSQKRISPLFFTHRYLLDWVYDPQAAKNGSHHFSFFIFPLGLNFDCQFFQIFILYLDLPLIANSSNFHFLSGLTSDCRFFQTFVHFIFFIWTYPQLPVLFIFFFSTWTYLWVPDLLIFFEKFWFIWIIFFLPKVFLKLLSSVRPFFILHSCFRWVNKYPM